MAKTILLKEKVLKDYLLLFLIALITYWPLSLGIFSLKNDALIYFLPWRYHISEAIQNGNFPFWNPYLFTGQPLYAEMPSGAWNPVVLLISLITRYNMTILEWELLFYIFLGSVGIYKLIKAFRHRPATALVGAISYMCCGFITDSASFISWISCAAYLPFCFLYFYRCCSAASILNSVKLGFSSFLLITTCDPGFFILFSYIATGGYICWILLSPSERKKFPATLKYISAAIGIFLVLSAPAILSFLDFLPYYKRGGGATLEQSLTDPFPPFAIISYLIPNAVVKPHEWLATDTAMRNAYTGIFVLVFFVLALTRKLTPVQKIITAIIIVSILFSFGEYTPLRKWCYQYLPLMNTFRHPASSRLFTSIGIIILASSAIERYIAGDLDLKKLKLITLITTGVLIAIISYYLLNGSFIFPALPATGGFKNIKDKLSFADLIIVQGTVQLLFVGLFLLFVNNRKICLWITSVNLVVFANMAMPFTVISASRTAAINNYLNNFPKNFPTPSLRDSIGSGTYSSAITDSPYGYSNFYNKRITIQDNVLSPTVNSSYIAFLNNRSLRDTLDGYPWAYISAGETHRDSSANLTITKFSPSSFGFNSKTNGTRYLHIFQQYNRRWKAVVNGNNIPVQLSNIAFMRVEIPAGTSSVTFHYEPGLPIRVMMYNSLLAFFSLIIYMIVHSLKAIRNGNREQ